MVKIIPFDGSYFYKNSHGSGCGEGAGEGYVNCSGSGDLFNGNPTSSIDLCMYGRGHGSGPGEVNGTGTGYRMSNLI